MFLAVCAVAGAFALYVFVTVKPYPINLDDVRLALSGPVNAEDGVLPAVKTLARSKGRVWVDLTEVPKGLTDAIVSTEDKGFYTNHGVDYLRTLEAAVNAVFHFLDIDQGGSTITQQMIKILQGNVNDRTYENKLKEIVTALDVNGKYSKDQIMEIYVNIVTLGDGCYGVQAASELYFGKNVSELDLAQCATLAAILPSPNGIYNPYRRPENVHERRGLVLRNMLEQGMITKQQYEDAVNAAVTFLE